jgi:hypothetical protein
MMDAPDGTTPVVEMRQGGHSAATRVRTVEMTAAAGVVMAAGVAAETSVGKCSVMSIAQHGLLAGRV